jgi:hypothetical protein
MNNSCDSMVNRTGDVPTCNAKPQPTAPPRARTLCMKAINSYTDHTVVSSLRNTTGWLTQSLRYVVTEFTNCLRFKPPNRSQTSNTVSHLTDVNTLRWHISNQFVHSQQFRILAITRGRTPRLVSQLKHKLISAVYITTKYTQLKYCHLSFTVHHLYTVRVYIII